MNYSIFDKFAADKLILSLILLWVTYSFYQFYKNKGGPPSVFSIPIIGNTFELKDRPREFLLSCQKKYGDVFSVNFLGKKIFVFTNKATEYLTKAHDMSVIEGRDQIFFVQEVLGEGKNSPGKPKEMLDNIAIVKELIAPMLKTMLPDVFKTLNRIIKEDVGDGTGSEGIDMNVFISKVVANSVSVILLGPELSKDKELIFLLGDYANKVDKCLRSGLLWHLVPFVGSWIAKYRISSGNPSVKEREFIRGRIEAHIEKRNKRKALGEKVESIGVVDALSDKGHDCVQIAHAIMILGFASISTTTRHCILLIQDLLAHPENFSQLRKEQELVTKDLKKSQDGFIILSKDDIEKMEYLNSAIRETLRHRAYHLEAWRLTHVDRVLPNGMKIPKGSLLALDLPSIHFNPESYGNNADLMECKNDSIPLEYQYNPFQFVESKIKATRVTQNFLSFGMGRHACPGRFFAVQEITGFVSTLLQKYRIETKTGKPMEFYTGDFAIPDPYIVLKPLESNYNK